MAADPRVRRFFYVSIASGCGRECQGRDLLRDRGKRSRVEAENVVLGAYKGLAGFALFQYRHEEATQVAVQDKHTCTLGNDVGQQVVG